MEQSERHRRGERPQSWVLVRRPSQLDEIAVLEASFISATLRQATGHPAGTPRLPRTHARVRIARGLRREPRATLPEPPPHAVTRSSSPLGPASTAVCGTV